MHVLPDALRRIPAAALHALAERIQLAIEALDAAAQLLQQVLGQAITSSYHLFKTIYQIHK